jgi:hypothetical protein
LYSAWIATLLSVTALMMPVLVFAQDANGAVAMDRLPGWRERNVVFFPP